MVRALTHDERVRLVAVANTAPSVHNTQPARWHFAADGAIWILSDPSRHLPAGDPTGRDAGLSCGAALEATTLALGDFGLEADGVDLLWNEAAPVPGLKAAARLTLRESAATSALRDQLSRRFTWRRPFLAASADTMRSMSAWAVGRSDFTLVSDPSAIAALAAFNDAASLGFLRDRDFRAELLSWMRLSPKHARWGEDGLNAASLGMSGVEAWGAGIVLSQPMFEALDAMGLSRMMVSERPTTLSARAIGLFHRPRVESPVATGRAYLSALLELSRLGLQTWPMSAVADDPAISAEVARLYRQPGEHRLVSVLRIGRVPDDAMPQRARLAPDRLIA